MRYDFSRQFDPQRARTQLESIIKRKGMCEILEKRYKRTVQQDRYLHLILGWFAAETGNTRDYVKTEYYKKRCNSEVFVQKKYDELLKEEVQTLRSSSQLNTKEMTDTVENFRNWASMEAGIYLPAPNEEEQLKWLEIELSKYEKWIGVK